VSRKLLIPFAAVIAAVMSSVADANAQAVSLQEQLAAQYKLAKMGSDSSGWSVVEEGTLLTIQKGGIKGSPYKNTVTHTSTYQEGIIHSPDPTNNSTAQKVSKIFCGLHKCPTTPDPVNDETATKLFKIGDKVYPTKIAVDITKDTVTMGIVACDMCNQTDPPMYNKANVVFQFHSGWLAKASAGDVEDTIGQLLSISNDQQSQQDQQGGQDQQIAAQAAPAAAAQQAEPQEIKLGMTTSEVEHALGKPEKTFSSGAKQIYFYKDMKVTFQDGKVADVQ